MSKLLRITAVLGMVSAMGLLGAGPAIAGGFAIEDPEGDHPIPQFDLTQVTFGQFPPEVMKGRYWIRYSFAEPWDKGTLKSVFSNFVGMDLGGRNPVQIGSAYHDGQESQFYHLIQGQKQVPLDYEVLDGSLVQILPMRAERDFADGVDILNILSAARPQETDEQVNDTVEGLPTFGNFNLVDDLGLGAPPMMDGLTGPTGAVDGSGVGDDDPFAPDALVLEDDGINPWACWGGGIGSGALGIGAAYGIGRKWRDRPRGQRYLFRGLVGGVPPLAAGLTTTALGEPGLGLALSLPYAGTYGLAWGSTKVWEPAQVIKKGFGWDEDDDGPLTAIAEPPPKKATRKKAAPKKAARKKTATKKTASKKAAPKKATRKKTATKKTASKKTTRRPPRPR